MAVLRVYLRYTGHAKVLAEKVAKVVLHVESSAVRVASACIGAVNKDVGLHRVWKLVSIFISPCKYLRLDLPGQCQRWDH